MTSSEQIHTDTRKRWTDVLAFRFLSQKNTFNHLYMAAQLSAALTVSMQVSTFIKSGPIFIFFSPPLSFAFESSRISPAAVETEREKERQRGVVVDVGSRCEVRSERASEVPNWEEEIRTKASEPPVLIRARESAGPVTVGPGLVESWRNNASDVCNILTKCNRDFAACSTEFVNNFQNNFLLPYLLFCAI